MKTIPPEAMRALVSRRQPWMSPGVTPVVMRIDEFKELRFAHHLTDVFPGGGRNGVYGQTVWLALTGDGRCVVVAFSWERSARPPVATANLLSITSNAHVTDEEGNSFGEYERFVVLSELVVSLEWQPVVSELAQSGYHS